MTFELKDIKDIRKKFNLTQGQLAKKAGVSQSLIAKIESGRLDPTYSNAQKIFQALESLGKNSIIKAVEIMNKKIIPTHQNDLVKEAIKKMKKHGISQMPVIENDNAVGLITESDILSKISEIDNPVKLINLVVKDVMEECPPIINKNTSSRAVQDLLLHYPVILVSDKGKLVGLITKADLLDKIYKN